MSDSPDFERNVAEILAAKHKTRWRVLWLWMVVFTAAVLFALAQNRHLNGQTRHLGAENQKRILENTERLNEIQNSRQSSCRTTYSVIQRIIRRSSIQNRNVIRARYRGNARQRGVALRAQRKQMRAILRIASPKQCKKQTKPKETP